MNSRKAEMYGRRLAILLEKDLFDSARRVVEEASQCVLGTWDMSFEELGLDARTAGFLYEAGLYTANDVRGETLRSLREISQIGRTGAKRVMFILERLNELDRDGNAGSVYCDAV